MTLKHAASLAAAIALSLLTARASAQPVTVVFTHGWSLTQDKGIWVQSMAEAMRDRAIANPNSDGGGAIFRYRQNDGAWQLVSGTPDPEQPAFLIYRWLEDLAKSGPDWGFGEGAADALQAALLDPHFVDATGQPLPTPPLVPGRHLHLLGHSRGTVINSELAQRFAAERITIDHITGMDPHPVNGTLDAPYDLDWGDPTPQRWSTTTFQDTYWRADGGGFLNGLDFDGIPIPNSHNVELDESALNCCADSFAHLDTHLWYHGTIDLGPNAHDGEHAITTQMRNTWWPMGEETTGFYFSQIGGGVAKRPSLPGGVASGAVPSVYGGDFPQASYAGWLYHGGSVTGEILNSAGRTFLRLDAGESATHNRLLLPVDAATLRLEWSVLTADAAAPFDELLVQMISRDATVEVARLPIGDVTNWTQESATLPVEAQRGQAVRMQFSLIAADANAASRIGIDSIEIERARPGDLDFDGSVNVFDLLALLGSWGSCGEHCPPRCIGDLSGADGSPDCAVNVFDLLALLGAWG